VQINSLCNYANGSGNFLENRSQKVHLTDFDTKVRGNTGILSAKPNAA
jgi:hypothetical protein